MQLLSAFVDGGNSTWHLVHPVMLTVSVTCQLVVSGTVHDATCISSAYCDPIVL